VRPLCFYSDFGYADDFAGTCRAVIARVAPSVRVIDITHGLRPRDVLGGALVVRNTLPYTPSGAVHLAVVDPGVGGERRAVALLSADDRLFVGPDNGLLTLATEEAGGVVEAFELTDPELWLRPVSKTFHGRDIFAPVAARLAAGLSPAAVGEALDPHRLVRLSLPAPRRERDGITATVVLIDRFGNAALHLPGGELLAAGLAGEIELLVRGVWHPARVASTYGAAPSGGLVILTDSYGQAAVAVNDGSAADVLHLIVGAEVRLRRLCGETSEP
jgi:S-adenosylmethionine hydrolase